MISDSHAALVLFYDVEASAVDDHDDWHTHEHMPERLSIPGFLRGSRWVAEAGAPRYLILYEVTSVAVLSSEPYLARLNDPTPWTSRIMGSFRSMRRGFCELKASAGAGLGCALLSIRHSAPAGRRGALAQWLGRQVLPTVSARPGVASARLFEPAASPPMTKEQSLRGKDAAVPSVLLVTGYSAEAVSRLSEAELAPASFREHGAAQVEHTRYHLAFALSASELRPRD